MIILLIALATTITIGIDSNWNFELNTKPISCEENSRCIKKNRQ